METEQVLSREGITPGNKFSIGEKAFIEHRSIKKDSQFIEWEDDLMPIVVRHWEPKHMQYLVQYLELERSYEYMGLSVEWICEDNIIRDKGEIITHISLRGNYFGIVDDTYGSNENYPSHKSIEVNSLWNIHSILSMEEVGKACKVSPDKKCSSGKCDHIIPEFLVTFQDGMKLLIFEFDANFIEDLTNVKTKRLSQNIPTNDKKANIGKEMTLSKWF